MDAMNDPLAKFKADGTEWRPIPGYAGLYSVSRDGRVLSHGRITTSRNASGFFEKTYKPRIMKSLSLTGRTPGAKGKVHRVNLIKDGEAKQFMVFALVRSVFGEEAARALPLEFFNFRPRHANRISKLSERVAVRLLREHWGHRAGTKGTVRDGVLRINGSPDCRLKEGDEGTLYERITKPISS